MKTTDEDDIEILQVGRINSDAGPDFLEAKLKIGETIWAGNVEIHVRASDFILHGHKTDPNYEKLILHVVYDNDLDVRLDLNCPTPRLGGVDFACLTPHSYTPIPHRLMYRK